MPESLWQMEKGIERHKEISILEQIYHIIQRTNQKKPSSYVQREDLKDTQFTKTIRMCW